MKEIKLTNGDVAFVDEDDFEYLNQFNWNCYKHIGYYKSEDIAAMKYNKAAEKYAKGFATLNIIQ